MTTIAAITTPLLGPKRSRDSSEDALETFALPRTRPRTATPLEAGADAAEQLPGPILSPTRLPLSPSKQWLQQSGISPRAVARFNLCGKYCLVPTYFNSVLHGNQPHAAVAPVALPSAADDRTSPTSVVSIEVSIETPVKTATPTATETPEKTAAEPTKEEGVRQRLAQAQAIAERKGIDGSLKWRYDAGDELTGATCAGVEFTREELMLLCS